jgi:hypothetical protein
MAEEWHRYERRETDQACSSIEEEPREVGRGATGGFFEEAGVTLEEEDVKDKV